MFVQIVIIVIISSSKSDEMFSNYLYQLQLVNYLEITLITQLKNILKNLD